MVVKGARRKCLVLKNYETLFFLHILSVNRYFKKNFLQVAKCRLRLHSNNTIQKWLNTANNLKKFLRWREDHCATYFCFKFVCFLQLFHFWIPCFIMRFKRIGIIYPRKKFFLYQCSFGKVFKWVVPAFNYCIFGSVGVYFVQFLLFSLQVFIDILLACILNLAINACLVSTISAKLIADEPGERSLTSSSRNGLKFTKAEFLEKF